MSKNISRLSGRKGLQDNLFENITALGEAGAEAHAQLADKHLLGEAITYGAASFYDLIAGRSAGKKALICDGSACLCAGGQEDVRAKLAEHLDESEIGHITCLGRCHENRAFNYLGNNYSGDDIDKLSAILSDDGLQTSDQYHVEALGTALLTADFPGIDSYYGILPSLLAKKPEEVLESMKTSNLRGRGGAGFPTGFKWAGCQAAKGDKKYVVCNADEGDPGAYIDRYLLEAQPHRVLFGMLLAGYVVGAYEGVLYIRAEYPESIAAVQTAIDDLARTSFLGQGICGTEFNFSFKIVAGAGAYICGEETALLASLEGRRPEVSVRPPYPTTEGLFGKPTVVNNVETFASVHHILSHGGEHYAGIGTEKSTGTKLLSLNGLFNRPGLYEVPMGTSLRTVVDDLGQGFREPVKALHIGGPLGGLVPSSKIDELTVDFESFNQGGFLLGHGSIVAIPESFPIIEYMEHLFEFCAVESCGKCFPCRIGSTRGQEMLHAAIHGERKFNRELLDDLLETMELGSLCAHGGGIPLPIKNALQYFDSELKAYYV